MELRTFITFLCLARTVSSVAVFASYESGSCLTSSASGLYNYCGFTGQDGCLIPGFTADPHICLHTIGDDDLFMECNDIPYSDSGFPRCAANQVFANKRYHEIRSGLGSCPNLGEWWQKAYTWDCCSCPSGYTTTGTDCKSGNFRGYCVKCDGEGEVLTSSFDCYRPGLTCNIIDNLAAQFAITSAVAPATNGYYRQVLNLACIRSNCENESCNFVRRFANTDAECQTLEGTFDFEQIVFSAFSTPPDSTVIQQKLIAIQYLADTIDDLLGAIESNPALNPVIAAILASARAFGPLDIKTIATFIAGVAHFMNELAENFYDYIENLVSLGCGEYADYDVNYGLGELRTEHNRLFKCAVGPGFDAELALGDLPPVSVAIAKILVPVTASLLREWDIANALNEQCVPPIYPSKNRKRQASNTTLPNNTTLDSKTTVEMYFKSLGAVLPTTQSLQDNLRNWNHDLFEDGLGFSSLLGVSVVKAEVSGIEGAILKLGLLSNATLEITRRDPDLDPFVIQATMFYPGQKIPTAMYSSQFADNPVSIIGPIVAIKDAATQIILINATHAMGVNFYDPLVPIAMMIAEFQNSTALPTAWDTHLLYRDATLLLSYIPDYAAGLSIDAGRDIAIFDLLLGEPLPNVTFTATSVGGIFTANLSLSHGIHAGSWSGGGMFALGLIRHVSNLPGLPFSTSSSFNQQAVSTTFSIVSSSTLNVVMKYTSSTWTSQSTGYPGTPRASDVYQSQPTQLVSLSKTLDQVPSLKDTLSIASLKTSPFTSSPIIQTIMNSASTDTASLSGSQSKQLSSSLFAPSNPLSSTSETFGAQTSQSVKLLSSSLGPNAQSLNSVGVSIISTISIPTVQSQNSSSSRDTQGHSSVDGLTANGITSLSTQSTGSGSSRRSATITNSRVSTQLSDLSSFRSSKRPIIGSSTVSSQSSRKTTLPNPSQSTTSSNPPSSPASKLPSTSAKHPSTSPTTHSTLLKPTPSIICKYNDCLRAVNRAGPSASRFCVEYLRGSLAWNDSPAKILKACHYQSSKVLSACSCMKTAS